MVELSFGSSHNFHVIHCAVRQEFALGNPDFCVIDGVGHYIEIISVPLHKVYVMRSQPLHKTTLSESFV